jgi:type IV pilus assembly protein PilV
MNRCTSQACRGFSLVEVMVALVVCAIGLLGLAKMESLAVSSTSVAAARSIAAIQASSLAAAMHANKGYWASGTAPASTTVTVTNNPNTVVISDPVLNSPPPNSCSIPGTNSCTMDQMAAFDVQSWATSLQTLLPGSFSTITCTTASFPVTCTIQIQWTENAVAANAQQNFAVNPLQTPTYELYVQP